MGRWLRPSPGRAGSVRAAIRRSRSRPGGRTPAGRPRRRRPCRPAPDLATLPVGQPEDGPVAGQGRLDVGEDLVAVGVVGQLDVELLHRLHDPDTHVHLARSSPRAAGGPAGRPRRLQGHDRPPGVDRGHTHGAHWTVRHGVTAGPEGRVRGAWWATGAHHAGAPRGSAWTPGPGVGRRPDGGDPAGGAGPPRDERNRRWASTMAGHGGSGHHLRPRRQPLPGTAPSDPPAGSTGLDRSRARGSSKHGAPGAGGHPGRTAAGSRSAPEEPDPWRTCFERDRDRILHATAFRRLAGKTQVFVFPDDHQRTRLTHALEVAQVATSVARACALNVALTEAIALGHDCGHGPGGHASEDALSPYLDGGLRPRPLGGGRLAGPAQPLRRDPRRDPQPLVVAPGPGHARRRGGQLGRPHRLCLPRLRGRRAQRHRHRRRPAGRGAGAVRGPPEPAARHLHRRTGVDHPRDRPDRHGRRAGRGPGRLPSQQLRAHLPPAELGGPGPLGGGRPPGPGRPLQRPAQPDPRRERCERRT